jgi:hypothetical protein
LFTADGDTGGHQYMIFEDELERLLEALPLN